MNTLKETTKIELDLSCRHAPKKLYAKQGDIDSRFITAKFRFGDRDFDHMQAARSELRVKKPDGTLTVNQGEISEEGITYPLSEQSLSASGKAQADFLLYGSSGEVISSVPALLFITEAPVGDEAVVSTNEYTAFLEEFESFKKSYGSQMAQMSVRIASNESRFGGLTFVKITQSDYDALESTDENTVYIITEGENDTE